MSAHDVVVELYYGAAWHDVTAADEVFTSTVVTFSRHGANQLARPNPGSASLALDNTSGKYNPYNPTSPVYGSLYAGMPMRITVDGTVRWTGRAGELAPSRELGGPRRTAVTGAGPLRQLGIGTPPAWSCLTRAILGAEPTAYWPLDEGPDANNIGSPLPGCPDLASTQLTYDDVDGGPGFPGKFPQFIASDGSVVGSLAAPTFSQQAPVTVEFWWRARCSDATVEAATPLVGWTMSGGEWDTWFVWARDPASTASEVWLIGEGSDTWGSWSIPFYPADRAIDDAWHQIVVTLAQDGTDVEVTAVLDGGVDSYTSSLAGLVGTLTAPETPWTHSSSYEALANVESLSIAHLAVYDTAPADHYQAGLGWPGEYAADRVERLAGEAGITPTVVGTAADDSQPMGAQPAATLLDLLWDCATTDGGILYEDTSGGITIRCLGAMCRQTAAEVSADDDVQPPLTAASSDRDIRNDATASRPRGASARVVVEDGPLGVDTVGTAQTEITVNPEDDAALGQYASWLLTQCMIDRVRYRQIVLDADASALDVDSIEIGTVIQLVDLDPVDDPTEPRMIVTDISESVGTHRRLVTLGLQPADPYDVGVLDAGGDGWLDCGACTLAENLTTTETLIDVACADACYWSHADGDYDILIGGERMTVTAVSAAAGSSGAWTQTLTVTRSVNGVVKTHTTGAEVHVADPFILSL